ncbi:MAG: efflux RND transporter periplasmic adaptor subunit [Parcubacteria group bacterium]|nr:efflux RND transporter periplasmic adaptor subunit [Parcubacteria group bacterium]
MRKIFQKLVANKYMVKLGGFARVHKFISSIAVLAIILAGYWGVGAWGDNGNNTRYVLAAVERGTITSSITGSGQVSASNQVEIKPKVSGDIAWVGIKSGDYVRSGTIIAQIDARDAQKTVRDAEANLESAKIALAKIKKPADGLSFIQTENSLVQAQENLKKAYDDSFNNLVEAFLELPGIVSGLKDVLYGEVAGAGQNNISVYVDIVKAYNPAAVGIKNETEIKYAAMSNDYQKSFDAYKSATRFSDVLIIDKLINQTYQTAAVAAEAIKSADNLLSLVQTELSQRGLLLPPTLNQHRALLADYSNKINTHLNNLLSSQNAITSAQRAVLEKTESLEKLKRGADDLDVASQELIVKQKENALSDAREKLADYYIRAPFEGTVASLGVKKSDNVSPATVAAVVVTNQKLAEISLNEIDIPEIKPGQKTELSFDAVESLTLTGEVAEIDTLGTVSQGVVTYIVKIAFNTDDARIKPGMSVTAVIAVKTKNDALLVPNSAVKSRGNGRFVESPEATNLELLAGSGFAAASNVSIKQLPVKIGISNDSVTEILEGLNEGDKIITRTINAQTSSNANSSAPSLFGPTGGSRSGGGGIRIQR